MKYMIINADDLGLTPKVSEGIIKGIKEGVVTRTSAMVCTQSRGQLLSWINQIPDHVGLHLQLTDGVPLSPLDQVSSLVGPDGRFPRNKDSWLHPNPDEVRMEWEAQIQWILGQGVSLTHVDTHHNVHRYPAILNIYMEIAKKYNLPTRPLNDNMANHFRNNDVQPGGLYYDRWQGDSVTPHSFQTHVLAAFRKINKKGIVEFACHPGLIDEDLRQRSRYQEPRELELSALCDPSLKDFLAEREIKLITSINAIANPIN